MELREVREAGGWKVEILEGDRSVSRCWIVDRQMRIGSCPVRTGGIAGVGTDREYRKQGLARQVLEASVALLVREGYDAAFLFGIQDFYHRFGFATCMAEQSLHLDTRDAERASRRARIRRMREADLPRIARLYNRDNAGRTASVVRRPGQWRGFPMGSQFGVEAAVQVVVDGQDRVQGYLAYDAVEHRARAAEVGGEGEEVFSTLLHFMARRAIQLRREELSFSLPGDHPFARFCRAFGCRVDTRFARNAGAMGRIIDLHSCLEKILPEMARRWGAGDREKILPIATEIGAGALRWEGEELILDRERAAGSPVRLSQEGLMLLLMGYRTPGDLLVAGRLKAPARLLPLLERLFPLQQAHMWWPDRF